MPSTQRALEFDEQDVRLGMDTYCLVTEEGAAHYGGITSWQLEPQRLVLRLEPGAAQVLGIDEEYTIELKISDERIQILRDGLMRVLASD